MAGSKCIHELVMMRVLLLRTECDRRSSYGRHFCDAPLLNCIAKLPLHEAS
jgi:hypothetical protein